MQAGIFNSINTILRFINGLKRPSRRKNLERLRQRGESITSYVIREAKPEDIPALAALHVRTWNETYEVGRPPTYQIREKQWSEQFSNMDGNWFCYLIEKPNKELVGFAKGIKNKNANHTEYTGELNKFYILRAYQRLGLGRKLFNKVAQRFISEGISKMVLFGIPQNSSSAFHEALGGKRIYNKGKFDGGYIWEDLGRLNI